jgi:acetyl-CoA carboxylase biotin carboxyl carrier protein
MKDDDPILLPEDVAEIIAILDGTLYDRLDIKTSRFTLRVARAGSGWTQSWEHAASGPEAQSVDTGSADLNKTSAVAEETGTIAVRAPLPGTFYRAPRPGAPPFVEVGASVEPNTVVGIIETMKVMNSVPAGIAGEIVAIVAENGAPVELDATLMRVRAQADGR